MPTTAAALRRATPLITLGGTLLFLGGCASVTPIGQLLNDPQHYNGKTVRIEGEVKESAGALGIGAYQVKDQTGTITVVNERGGSPRTGARIGVKGTFESLFTLGSKSLAVLREESRNLR